MRVIAGKFRSRALKAADHFRPTKDRVRETLFNILQNDIEGSIFVDGFAGSGSVGIEALSRGASVVYFLESNRKTLFVLEENLKSCCQDETWRILSMDVWKALEVLPQQLPDANIIFFDPPYEFVNYSKLLVAAGRSYPGALHIIEHSSRKQWPTPAGFQLKRLVPIGETQLSFFRTFTAQNAEGAE